VAGELLLSNKLMEPNLGLHHSWLATSHYSPSELQSPDHPSLGSIHSHSGRRSRKAHGIVVLLQQLGELVEAVEEQHGQMSLMVCSVCGLGWT
jgi:hypothetical protein